MRHICEAYSSARVQLVTLNGNIESLKIDGHEKELSTENVQLAAKLANPNYDLYRGWNDMHILLDGELRKIPCAECPWFNICEMR